MSVFTAHPFCPAILCVTSAKKVCRSKSSGMLAESGSSGRAMPRGRMYSASAGLTMGSSSVARSSYPARAVLRESSTGRSTSGAR